MNRAVLLDVSMETCPKTIDGSVRIPLYQPIDGWSVPKILRRAGFAAFGVDGTGITNISIACKFLEILI